MNALIIEDDPAARTLLAEYLRARGWTIQELPDGKETLQRIQRYDFDVIFIDLMLPDTDGHSLCKEIRKKSQTGIIFTTSCDDPVERVIALENGADAYYAKPIPMRELLACAKNLSQRVRSGDVPVEASQAVEFRHWCFSPESMLISNQWGESCNLTRTESRLFEFMIKNIDKPLTRDELGHSLGRTEWLPGDRGIDVLVSKLRNKLSNVSRNKQIIQTRYGIGYVFTPGNS
ncbi:response regulator transcription factor [Pelagibaculum spongiae]|uniref:DNA-binding response regulator n=1 Tax=Pelagibaculum spongiae TaxID=2080658 RepID=A0A2V1GZS2_9GAMM|nr:response regulator transcription factor [Pelagibaculum spongiae]PVZ67639.1 DNA-binding response regulator [Pelagibaculum spongiae]